MFYLTGFEGQVCDNALVFTPDGGTLASGSDDNVVHLWDVGDRRLRRTLRGHTDGVDGLCVIPGTTLLASGSWDHTVRIWDHTTGKRVKKLNIDFSVCALDASPDGRTLAVAGGDWGIDTVYLWDTSTWKKRAEVSNHDNQVGVVRFTPDGKRLITGAADRRAGVWDVTTGDAVCLLTHTGWVWSADVHGNTLAVAAGRRVTLWSLPEEGRAEQLRVLDTYRNTVVAVAFSPDGGLLATGGKDGIVRIWDLGLNRFTRNYNWKIGEVHALCFAPDGMTMAAGGVGKLVVWDVD